MFMPCRASNLILQPVAWAKPSPLFAGTAD